MTNHDDLNRLITTMSVKLHAFGVCEVARGWRLAFEPMGGVTVHYVLAGAGVLAVGGSEAVTFGAGDMIIVPAGRAMRFGEAGDAAIETGATLNNVAVVGGGLVRFRAGPSRDTVFVCGEVAAALAGGLDLFALLKAPLAERTDNEAFLTSAYALLIDELAAPSVGTQALTEGVIKQGLVLLLRRHLFARGPDSPLFAHFGDPRLLRAITSVLECPPHPHSVESMAATAGMSRSAFAAAFSARYDQGPMDFVRDARLRAAAELLKNTDLPVKLVCAGVGYLSRSYFSRAFREMFGVDPTKYRDRALQ